MQIRKIGALSRNVGLALASALVSSAVFAQSTGGAVDVSASVTEITSMKTAVLAIGAAVFAVALGVKLYKWIKSAL